MGSQVNVGTDGARSPRETAPSEVASASDHVGAKALAALERHPTLALCVALAGAVALRVYGLDWGVPYHHFQADEYAALSGAELLRHNPDTAAHSVRFFVYPALPRYILGWLVNAFELLAHPLDLASVRDQITLTLLGRSTSVVFGAATVWAAFSAARSVGGTVLAGLVSALLLAASVEHIRNSHFFIADVGLTFFCALTLIGLVRLVDRGDLRSYLLTGVSFGAALACKYTAAFLALPIALACLMAPTRPPMSGRWLEWRNWGVRIALLVGATLVVFVGSNPLMFRYPARVNEDISEQIVATNFGSDGPIWTSYFSDVQPLWLFWFTNLLPWGLGPPLVVCGLAGLGWLAFRGGPGRIVAVYSAAYYAAAVQTTTPYVRYILPLIPVMAIAAGVLSSDLIKRPRSRQVGIVAALVVVGSTWLWALAYMKVYSVEDVRVQAARFIRTHIPQSSHVLVEPSQGTPPMGSHWTDPRFYESYVAFGRDTTKADYYFMHTLDVYEYLYDRGTPVAAKRQYIEERVRKADYVVMDDSFLEFYHHLHGPEHAPVREYYDDLFAGRLGFDLVRRFSVKPSLFGWKIQDEAAEMTFTLFDHPDVFVFSRRSMLDRDHDPSGDD